VQTFCTSAVHHPVRGSLRQQDLLVQRTVQTGSAELWISYAEILAAVVENEIRVINLIRRVQNKTKCWKFMQISSCVLKTRAVKCTDLVFWPSLYVRMKQKMMWWQWHKLNRMQIICTSLKTDDHASTSSLNFYRPDAFSDAQPTVSKHWRQNVTNTSLNKMYSIFSETWKFKNLNLKSSVSNMWTPIGYRTSCQWRELCSLEVNLLPNEWKSENLVIIKCINSHFIVDFVLQ